MPMTDKNSSAILDQQQQKLGLMIPQGQKIYQVIL